MLARGSQQSTLHMLIHCASVCKSVSQTSVGGFIVCCVHSDIRVTGSGSEGQNLGPRPHSCVTACPQQGPRVACALVVTGRSAAQHVTGMALCLEKKVRVSPAPGRQQGTLPAALGLALGLISWSCCSQFAPMEWL